MPALILTSNFGNLTGADSRLFISRRLRSGAVMHGGQIGNVDKDLASWVDSNAWGIHTDKTYWGFWAFNPGPLRSTPKALSLDEATAYEGDDEIARVPHSTALRARCTVSYPEQLSGAFQIQFLLKNATTGAIIQNSTIDVAQTADGGTAPVVTVALPALTDGLSALLWARIRGAKQPYTPPRELNGYSGTPRKWTHADGTQYEIDTRYLVGAMPYDVTDTQQARILAEIAINKAAGNVIKNPAWIHALITFEADGTQAGEDSEYSCLKIVAGAGAWIGDSNVHLSASVGACLWQTVSNALVAQKPADCRARCIGAIKEFTGDAGTYYGGFLSGRSGPVPFVARVDNSDVDTGTGKTSVSTFICECAMQSSFRVNSLVKIGDIVYALTSCDIFAWNPLLSTQMTATHPGGRSLVVIGSDNKTLIRQVEYNDFAYTDVLGTMHFAASVLGIPPAFGGSQSVGVGASHLVDSCATLWRGACYTVEEDTQELIKRDPTVLPRFKYMETVAEQADNRQYVRAITQGGTERKWGWKRGELGDYGRLAACGENLLIFGQSDDVARSPRALRRGEKGLDGITTPHHVTFCDSVISADGSRENVMGIMVDDSGPTLSWIPFETDGRVAGEAAPTGDASDAIEAGSRVFAFHPDPEQTQYPAHAVLLGENKLDYKMAAVGRENAAYWLRVDPAEPLPQTDDPLTLTVEQLAQIATFKKPVVWGRECFLPRPANEIVEVLIILPPDEPEYVEPNVTRVL